MTSSWKSVLKRSMNHVLLVFALLGWDLFHLVEMSNFCDSSKLLFWTSHKVSGMKKAYPDVSHPKAEDNKDVLNHSWKYCFLAMTDEGTKVIVG